MIITGGENVLPAEIESVLSVHPGVAEAAVAGLADERWGQKVAAFIVRSGAVDAAALDAHCRASALADFKRPRAYVFVRAIPKSPVGKVLRRLLIAGAYEEDGGGGGDRLRERVMTAGNPFDDLDGFRVGGGPRGGAGRHRARPPAAQRGPHAAAGTSLPPSSPRWTPMQACA